VLEETSNVKGITAKDLQANIIPNEMGIVYFKLFIA
jgi:hypothetical protein